MRCARAENGAAHENDGIRSGARWRPAHPIVGVRTCGNERCQHEGQQRYHCARRQHRGGGWRHVNAAMHVFLAQEALVGVERRLGRVGCRYVHRTCRQERLRQVVKMGLDQETLHAKGEQHDRFNSSREALFTLTRCPLFCRIAARISEELRRPQITIPVRFETGARRSQKICKAHNKTRRPPDLATPHTELAMTSIAPVSGYRGKP